MAADTNHIIAFQGLSGAFSEIACHNQFPDWATLPCPLFEDLFAAVESGAASLGMCPLENSVAGRVADVHHLLPKSNLHIVGEYFLRIEQHLLAPKGATLETLKEVYSHVHALGQCRAHIRELGLTPMVHADTAGAAADVAEWNDPTKAAIGSELAAKTYGLQILKRNMEDADHNTTRFIILSKAPAEMPVGGKAITSLLFTTKSVPAALYKAIGGFATNSVNITKLESYTSGKHFEIAQFFMEIEGHPEEAPVARALDELHSFSKEVRILGTYPADSFRDEHES